MALVREGQYLYVLIEGLCGEDALETLPISVSLRLAGQFGIEGVSYETVADVGYVITDTVSEEDLQPGIFKLLLPEAEPAASTTTATSTPAADPEETATTSPTLPNLTNAIAFEVKAVSEGQVVADWQQVDKVTIPSGTELYFRWSGTDYQQCLPFLQDNGNYALTVKNQAMVSGNTESEGYNITEKSGVYRVECGGQRNNEFGVDAREIEVKVE